LEEEDTIEVFLDSLSFDEKRVEIEKGRSP